MHPIRSTLVFELLLLRAIFLCLLCGNTILAIKQQDLTSCSSHGDQVCRCLFSSNRWPDEETWQAFNASVDGRLLVPKPSAAPCHECNPDAVLKCQTATQEWHNPFWRADQPGAMQSPNREADGDAMCRLPTNTSSPMTDKCQQGAVPSYAVRVATASHVQTAILFAAKHHIKLTIKSTGHDIMGRSTAPRSLNIWVHHLKEITFYENFIPQRCPIQEVCGNLTSDQAGFTAVRLGAGVQWGELYEAADKQGKVVVGGMSGSVSTVGGFLQGGGHSPLSPLLGLASDNVIELVVVTADGRIRTANACQNQDLFWALRGGGGGTFGVVISATYKTYPALHSITGVQFTALASSASSYLGLVTRFVELQASLSQADAWAGYSYFSLGSITASYLLPCITNISSDITPDAIFARDFEPLISYIDENPNELAINITVIQSFPSFLDWHGFVLCRGNPGVCSDATGFYAAIASWLLPIELLKDNATQVAEAFMEMLGMGVDFTIGHLVGGRAVSTSQNNAVNPAWRMAVWHVVLECRWTAEEAGRAREEERMRLLTAANGLLRQLAPESGCYVNEADMNDPAWPTSFFGSHVDRLRLVKHQVDPQHLFTCKNCVAGAEGKYTHIYRPLNLKATLNSE